MTQLWVPILTGDDAAAAEQAVLRIADALTDEAWAPEQIHFGLAGGTAGLALFYQALSERWPDADFLKRRDRHWNSAIDSLAEATYAPPNLYSGFSGVGWATAVLNSLDQAHGETDDAHDDLEEALLGSLMSIRDPADYDLINGPAGWGLYALERWPSPRATQALELIVDFFDARAEWVPEGVRWHTAPQLLPPWQREHSPEGYYNMGLSHGVPGVWVLLAHTLARGIRPDRSKALLEGAVSWVLSQRWKGDGPQFFGSRAGAPESPGTRLAWCYGDLGIAAALFVAGQLAARADWTQEALSLARAASTLTRETCKHADAQLCHGPSGVGHIFNRLYQATGEEKFSSAAAYWLRVALDMREEGIGPGGYAAWRQDPPGWLPNPGLLEGSAGVALALLAAIHDREPVWDRFLAISPVPMNDHLALHATSGTVDDNTNKPA